MLFALTPIMVCFDGFDSRKFNGWLRVFVAIRLCLQNVIVNDKCNGLILIFRKTFYSINSV